MPKLIDELFEENIALSEILNKILHYDPELRINF